MRFLVWPPRSRVLTFGGVFCLAVGLGWLTWWLLGKTASKDGKDGAWIATVLALPATALGTLATVYGLRSRRQADGPTVLAATARTLSTQVHKTEERTLQRLLGDPGVAHLANIRFAQPEAALLRWRTDGGESTGTLATIADFYDKLDHRRLVVLGDAGAGKTVLIIKLLLELADATTAPDVDSTCRVRVPVRLSLPTFPGTHETTDPDVMRDRLDTWVAEHLTTVYKVERTLARALVTNGWVLPILDGLDEMDLKHTHPARARAVLAALNVPAGPGRWQVVLTCRTKHYYQIAEPDLRGKSRALQDATAITLDALAVDEVIAWLVHHFPDPTQPDGIQQRWRSVITTIRRHPTGRLAHCLTLPLRLYLAVTIYRRETSNPRKLCQLSTIALDEHLFSELIPAIAADHPRYAAAQVERWLRTLANHLAWMAAHGHSGVDLHLHELWRTTGDPTHPGRRIHHQAAVLSATLVVLPMLGIGVWNAITAGGYLLYTIISVAIIGRYALFKFKTSSSFPPQRLDLRQARIPAGRHRLAFGLMGAITLAVIGGLAFRSISGFIGGFTLGLPFGLAFGLDIRQQTANRPSDPMRQALVHVITYIIAFTFTGGFAYWLAFWSPFGLKVVLAAALTFALSSTLADSPWPLYAVTVCHLAAIGDLHTRPGRFLDWAYAAGLVRLAGAAVQFRHRELQAHLATTTTSGTYR